MKNVTRTVAGLVLAGVLAGTAFAGDGVMLADGLGKVSPCAANSKDGILLADKSNSGVMLADSLKDGILLADALPKCTETQTPGIIGEIVYSLTGILLAD